MSAGLEAKVKEIASGIDFEKNAYELTLKTSMGDIHLEFLPDVAPNHCRNMLWMMRKVIIKLIVPSISSIFYH